MNDGQWHTRVIEFMGNKIFTGSDTGQVVSANLAGAIGFRLRVVPDLDASVENADILLDNFVLTEIPAP